MLCSIVNFLLHNGHCIFRAQTIHVDVFQSIILLIHFVKYLPCDIPMDLLLRISVLLLRHLISLILQFFNQLIVIDLVFSLNLMVVVIQQVLFLLYTHSVHPKVVLTCLLCIGMCEFLDDHWGPKGWLILTLSFDRSSGVLLTVFSKLMLLHL